MTRPVTKFGSMPTDAPEGTFKRIHFPQLAEVDNGTKEGFLSRILHSEGGDVRDLPRTIYFQKTQAPGHDDAVAIGALYEATLDPDGKTLRDGWGWLADVPEAHDAARFVISKALHHNSVDLSETKTRLEFIEGKTIDDFKVEIHFDEWKLGATTLVGKPAFANASAEIPEEEITAALASDEPLVVECDNVVSAHTPTEEIIAAGNSLPSWDYFHRAEADIPHSIIVGTKDADGWIPIYGHLALWNQPHTGYDGVQKYPPRPRNEYREFNKPSVLTDRGQVEAGPMVLFGGHVSLADACNDPKNAWADVKVTAGKHGPWICGVVRPHIAEDDVNTYVARASQISGHWKGDNLRMIVCCNTPGFNIPGIGRDAAEPDELVASFVVPEELTRMSELSDEVANKIFVKLMEQLTNSDGPVVLHGTTNVMNEIKIVKPDEASEPDLDFEKTKLALTLELDDDDD